MGATISRRELVAMLLAAVLLLLMFELTSMDFWLADRYYQSGRFVGQGNWWLEVVSHRWIKHAVVAVAVAVWLRVAIGFASKRWAVDRRRWLAVGLALLLAPAAVSGLKHSSGKHCPWDLTRYGGPVADTGLLGTAPAGAPIGQCFPAGHASTGFSLFAFALLWRGSKPRRAWLAWSLALLAGMLLGWGQQLRGAHFLSHTLWSAWLCWAICLVVFAALRPARAKGTGVALAFAC